MSTSIETVDIDDEEAEDDQKLKNIFRDKVRARIYQDGSMSLNHCRPDGMEK